MPLIIPPGYCQAVYEMTTAGDPEPMVVTLGHELLAPAGSPNAIANDLFDAFNTGPRQALSSAYTFTAVDVYIGQDGPDHIVGTSNRLPVAGANAGTVVPQNTAYLIRKRTDLAGRRGRGRMYFPGVKETEVDNVGVLSAAQVTQWTNVLALWMTDLTSGLTQYPPVILHRSEGAGVEPLPTPVSLFVCETKVATQRRRLRP